MKIWANTIVHNEENFIWFAIMSIVDYMDKILVWDTGSTDRTVDIIREIRKIKGDKVDFKEVGPVDKFKFSKMRQAMLDKSKCDWILILDGDEIWWEDSIRKIKERIKKEGNKLDAIAVPFYNLVGDIYHYQSLSAGQYKLLGRKGHLTLKAINRKISGLHWSGPYDKESFFDLNHKLIQEREGIIFQNTPYLHVTHLRRSSKARTYNKFKFEIGERFPKDFVYPEVFYTARPDIIPDPWRQISWIDLILASIMTPLRKIKRKLQDFKPNE